MPLMVRKYQTRPWLDNWNVSNPLQENQNDKGARQALSNQYFEDFVLKN